ncbi:hypothetical protein HU230_0012445 [Bradyrhizobium quebecense]|nr:hypothetical protein [Bradyrhizobium quebecense]UGA46798.1 hypothetical protein HU230_0012445 [Bradyrhizobium quebecense]
MSKPTTMSDEDIVTRVLAVSTESVGWLDSKLSRERERVTKYYNGVLPARQHEGSSSYVSTDVYDAVEMAKAQVAETFSGGDSIAQFDPDQDMSVEECRKASLYASYIIYQQNPGFNIFTNVIHDGLMARNGIAKVYWEKRADYKEETFEALPHDDAQALAAQDDVHEFDGSHNGDETYSGSLTRKLDCSQVTIDNVPPDEFLIAPRAVSIAKAPYVAHRTPKTRAELIEMGFDKKKVTTIISDEADPSNQTQESMARNAPVDNNLTQEPVQEEMRQMMLYEEYVRMQIDKSKGVRLYRICRVGNVLLSREEVDRAPFLCYTPLPVPHVFYGNNFAARVIPVQNARTVLVRGILDHTAITNNPRWQVVNGGLLNPREMLENRLGGLVNVRRPDSVTPLPQTSLNPFVFQTLGLLKEDKEQSTGISSVSQGMNKDAISTQNSKGLIDQMVSLSGQRGKISARHFANNFVVPLMIEVIRLAIINEAPRRSSKSLAVPSKWTRRAGRSAPRAPCPCTSATARRTRPPTRSARPTSSWARTLRCRTCSARRTSTR